MWTVLAFGTSSQKAPDPRQLGISKPVDIHHQPPKISVEPDLHAS
jgi:hypothetical protein